MSYFDFIPHELLQVVMGYYIQINSDNILIFKNILDLFDIDINKDFNILFKYSYPEYYEVLLDEVKLFKVNNPELLLYDMKRIIEYPKFEYDSNIFILNIYYRKKFKDQFTGLYELVKDFDLSIGGSSNKINYYDNDENYEKDYDYKEWKGFWFRLNHIHHSDWLTEKLLNFRDTGKLPDNYIYDSEETPIANWSYVAYLYYAMTFANNYKFELQMPIINYYILLSAFWHNRSIYERMKVIIPDKSYREMLTDEEVIS